MDKSTGLPRTHKFRSCSCSKVVMCRRTREGRLSPPSINEDESCRAGLYPWYRLIFRRCTWTATSTARWKSRETAKKAMRNTCTAKKASRSTAPLNAEASTSEKGDATPRASIKQTSNHCRSSRPLNKRRLRQASIVNTISAPRHA
eukprot:6202636-Pleurochrysis_carterae.AAC.2